MHPMVEGTLYKLEGSGDLFRQHPHQREPGVVSCYISGPDSGILECGQCEQ